MIRASGRLRLRAYAKINWTLEVIGRRPDGYHELSTVLQTIALHDDLDVAWPASEDKLTAAGALPGAVPLGAENLAERALSVYRSVLPLQQPLPPVALRLHKAIPPAAGLGGGSSDGAAVLRALDAINPRPFGVTRLEQLAAQLGSDAPFFVRGGTQLAAGRGERLTPLPDAPRTWLVLALGAAAGERKTARLFALLRPGDLSDGGRTEALVAAIRRGEAPAPALLYNAFEHVEAAAFPELEPVRTALTRECGHALLCGAGPSLLAVVADEAEARRAAAALRRDGLQAIPARTITAAEVAAAPNEQA